MRDAGIFNLKRALPRMSWSPKNLFNLWNRTAGNKVDSIRFTRTSATLFQQRWRSKAVVRAYHGDYINEKIFKRWYLPETLPDVRPRLKVTTGDMPNLMDFARRKGRVPTYQEELEEKGMPPVGSLMFAEVERRIDVFLFRCCFAHSVYEARRLVIHGDVLLNGKKHQNANTRLAPGDMVSVNPKAIRFFKPQTAEYDDVNDYDKTNQGITDPAEKVGTPFYLPLYASPWLFIPAYIEPNFATCSAVYVRHPTARPGYSEIPTPYDADGEIIRFAWEWYVKRRTRVRSNTQLARMPEDRARAQMEDIEEGRRKLRRDTIRVSQSHQA